VTTNQSVTIAGLTIGYAVGLRQWHRFVCRRWCRTPLTGFASSSRPTRTSRDSSTAPTVLTNCQHSSASKDLTPTAPRRRARSINLPSANLQDHRNDIG